VNQMRGLVCVVIACAGLEASSCAPTEFQDASLVSSVRILTSSAEPPYAKPRSSVEVHVLAFDGRPIQPAPMRIFWLPLVCENPKNDAYYACFQQFASLAAAAGTGAKAGDAGIARDGGEGGSGQTTSVTLVTACDAGSDAPSGGLGTALVPGTDLTPALPQGDCVDFVMPSDAVTANPNKPTPPTPYGLAILFNIACAGHLELVPQDPNNVQSPPLACFDAQHNRLGPNDFVFGFTRVYAYDMLENANPSIDSIDVNGQPLNLDPDAGPVGIDVPHCVAGSPCPNIHIGPVVPASSQEPDPAAFGLNIHPGKEQVWAEFYSTLGSFTSAWRLLYDPVTGSVGPPADTDTEFQVPDHPGGGTIWIIVHDNRGGATWATVPLRVN
jgi:hypothetical protein